MPSGSGPPEHPKRADGLGTHHQRGGAVVFPLSAMAESPLEKCLRKSPERFGREAGSRRRPYSFVGGVSFEGSHRRFPLAPRSQDRAFGPFSSSAWALARSALICSRIDRGSGVGAGAACPSAEMASNVTRSAIFIDQLINFQKGLVSAVWPTRHLFMSQKSWAVRWALDASWAPKSI